MTDVGSSATAEKSRKLDFSPKALTLPLDVAASLSPQHPAVTLAHKAYNAQAPNGKMLVIVPYAEASDTDTTELTTVISPFLKQLDAHLTKAGKLRGRDFAILAVQQDSYDVAINRGALANAGAKLAADWGYDYIVIHDPRYLPASDLNTYDLGPGGVPVHYYVADAGAVPKGEPQLGKSNTYYLPQGHCFGGAFAANISVFFKTQGYPNTLWGLGAEDGAIMRRMRYLSGFHRLSPTAGQYRKSEVAEPEWQAKTRSGILSENNKLYTTAQQFGTRITPTVEPDGLAHLNATVTAYAPIPAAGAVHWARVRLDTLHYRPTATGSELPNLTARRGAGELPPLKDVGVKDDTLKLTTVPFLTPSERSSTMQYLAFQIDFYRKHITSNYPILPPGQFN